MSEATQAPRWGRRAALAVAAVAMSMVGVAAAAGPAAAHNPFCDASTWYNYISAGTVQSHAEVTGCRGYLSGTTYYGRARVEHTVSVIPRGSTYGWPVFYEMKLGNRNHAFSDSPMLSCPIGSGQVYNTTAVGSYKHHGSWTTEDIAYSRAYCI